MTIASIRSPLQISWELLPDDYPLPDDPVDNIDQPLLAEALRESLARSGWSRGRWTRIPAAPRSVGCLLWGVY